MLTYLDFKKRHKEYRPAYWSLCRLLDKGGDDLLSNDAAMRRIMPQHPAEPDGQYAIRRLIATYEGVAPAVLSYIRDRMSRDPLRIECEGAPAFYEEFADDTSPVGGLVCTLFDLVRALVHHVMLYKRAWLRVDMPRGGEYPSLAVQEAEGALRAYVTTLEPENVVNWKLSKDGSGQLSSVMLMEVVEHNDDVLGSDAMVTERYTRYTATACQSFEFPYDREKNPEGPKDNDQPVVGPLIPHSFGKVPVLKMEPPEANSGLYAMGQLEPLARRHTDSLNALNYAEKRVLFCPRTVFIDPGTPMDAAEEADPKAVAAQPQGTATVITMRAGAGAGDRVEYPSPPTDVFKHAAESQESQVEAMHRALNLMALNVKQTPSAVGRSGESKKEDRSSSNVVLSAFGQLARTFVSTELYPIIAHGRDPENAGGEQDLDWTAHGMEHFDDAGGPEVLEMAAQWALQPFQSPTMNVAVGMKLCRSVLPDETDEFYDKVEAELGLAHTVEAAAGEAEAKARTAVAEHTEENPAPPEPKGKKPGAKK